MLAIVEDINAPSKERLRLLTLSIYKFISITFLDDIDLLITLPCYIVFKRRAKLSLLACSGCKVLLTVVLDVYPGVFFLKSILLSLFDVEYFVLEYLVSLFPEICTDFF